MSATATVRGPEGVPASGAPLTPEEVNLLATYLADETTMQRALLVSLEEKERKLVEQDPAGLKQCLKDATPMVSRLEELTHRRVRVLRSLGKRLGLDADAISLGEVIAHAPAADQERLEGARSDLREVLVAIGRQNRKNQVLLRNGIEVNRAVIHALFGDGQVSRTYDRAARTREAPPTRSFLDQEL